MANKIVDNFSCKGKRKNKAPKKGLLREGANVHGAKSNGSTGKGRIPYPELPHTLNCCTTELENK